MDSLVINKLLDKFHKKWIVAESRKEKRQGDRDLQNRYQDNNVLTKIINETTETGSDTSSSASTTAGNKSYSGILASNKEYSSYFENQEQNLNKSQLNLERNELSLHSKKKHERRSKANKSNTSLSNETSSSRLATAKKSRKHLDANKLRKNRSSTIKARLNHLNSLDESLSKTDVSYLNKENNFVNKLSNRLKDKNKG